MEDLAHAKDHIFSSLFVDQSSEEIQTLHDILHIKQIIYRTSS